MFLGREALEDHSQIPKKANKCSVGAVISFRMHGGIRMSASSLHRESTDSLIHCIQLLKCLQTCRAMISGVRSSSSFMMMDLRQSQARAQEGQ